MSYFGGIVRALDRVEAAMDGKPTTRDEALSWLERLACAAHESGDKLIFVGNGGSAAIASHMAVDYSKNLGVRAIALNDGPMLTCISNDLGYDEVFAHQLDLHARRGDVVVCISSSGMSKNILKAAETAKKRGCTVVALTGFDPSNFLRALGDISFYVPAQNYGHVEIAHLALLHSLVRM